MRACQCIQYEIVELGKGHAIPTTVPAPTERHITSLMFYYNGLGLWYPRPLANPLLVSVVGEHGFPAVTPNISP